MNTQNWLTLIEYSAKHRVSLSTLRRRIKADEIEYKLIEGKYLLKDADSLAHPTTTKTATALKPAGPETIAPPQPMSSQRQPVTPYADTAKGPEANEIWTTTQSLLGEIKKAYSLILQEKQQHIFQLKEEAADLRTLVRVLEDENQRLRNSIPSLDLDLGLEA